jgi:hypothetical protein
MHKVLILAQGSGSRWDFRGQPFLNAPKQLVKIDGETLVGRARRLFTEAGCDVTVIAPQDPRFGQTVTLDNPHITGTEQDKFIASRHLWSATDRTIIAWGDCYYTQAAIDKITQHKSDDLHYFRRPTASKTTGHRWDESFAVSFGPHEHERVLQIADKVVEAVKDGRVKKDHIRTHYAASLGLPMDDASKIINTLGQTVIDDWTDDFDRPDEWARWVGRYYAGKVGAALCGCWRDGDKYRADSKAFVDRHYQSVGAPIYGTAAGKNFNRAAARNAAINKAFEDPAIEVAFIFDSDTYVPLEQFWAACYLAKISNRLVLAFDEYYRLEHNQKERAASNPLAHHASGAVAISRELWDKVGGYDERFVSWGGEDRAFWIACNAINGQQQSTRVPGPAYHIWHPPSPERNKHLPEYQANIALGMRYKEAAGIAYRTGILPTGQMGEIDIDAIYSIMREDGGPLNMTSKGKLLEFMSIGKAANPDQAQGQNYEILRRSTRGKKGDIVAIEPQYVKRLQELGIIGYEPVIDSIPAE